MLDSKDALSHVFEKAALALNEMRAGNAYRPFQRANALLYSTRWKLSAILDRM